MEMRLKQRLDATFERINTVDFESTELHSDFAKYLCVLVSGYLERAIIEIIQEYARRNASLSVSKFVDQKTNRFSNARPQKIQDLLSSFDSNWGHEIQSFFNDPINKDSINTIVSHRNRIAHGLNSHLTVTQVKSHYLVIQKLVDKIREICMKVD